MDNENENKRGRGRPKKIIIKTVSLYHTHMVVIPLTFIYFRFLILSQTLIHISTDISSICIYSSNAYIPLYVYIPLIQIFLCIHIFIGIHLHNKHIFYSSIEIYSYIEKK